MVSLFERKHPLSLIVLVLVLALVIGPDWLNSNAVQSANAGGPLYEGFIHAFSGISQFWPAIYPALAALLLFLQAISLNYVFNERKLLPKSSFLPGLSLLLVAGQFPEWHRLSPQLCVNTLMMGVFIGMLGMANHSKPKSTIFNLGLLIGISSFLYFPAIGYIALLLFAVLIMRPFKLPELLLSVIGTLTPFYFYGIYLFLTNQFTWEKCWPGIQTGFPDLPSQLMVGVAMFALLIPFLIGGFQVQQYMRKMLINIRKGWSLTLVYLLVALLVPFIAPRSGMWAWTGVIIPLAAFQTATLFFPRNKWWPELLVWSLLLVMMLGRFSIN